MGIESYSTTPGSNNSAPPNGWPEGMAPSAVNDTARQLMADIRTWYQLAEWVNHGYTHTYASGTSFTVNGLDVTATYTVGRRIKAVGSSTGTIYGTIVTSSFSTNTTVTIVWDSGSLSNEALTVSLSILNFSNNAVPGVLRFPATQIASSNVNTLDDYEEGTWTPADGSGAALSFSTAEGTYIKIGKLVTALFHVVYPATADTSNSRISGLPFTSAGSTPAGGGGPSLMTVGSAVTAYVNPGATTVDLYDFSAVRKTNANLTAKELTFTLIYIAAA